MWERKPIFWRDLSLRILGLAMTFLGLLILGLIICNPGFSARQAESFMTYKTAYFMPPLLVIVASSFLFAGGVIAGTGHRFREFLPMYLSDLKTKKQWMMFAIGIGFIFTVVLGCGWFLEWPFTRPSL